MFELSLYEYVEQLATTTVQVESYTRIAHNRDGSLTEVTERHRTESAPLLHQLREAVGAVGYSHGTGGGPSGQGQVPVALEALSAYAEILRGVAVWCRRLERLGYSIAPDDPESALIKLRAAAADLCCSRPHGRSGTDEQTGRRRWCCRHHHLEHDVHGWWSHARVVTGWDTPPWRPPNTCPLCTTRGSLRISVDASDARCIECRSIWFGDAQIKLLAAHIRTENGETGSAA